MMASLQARLCAEAMRAGNEIAALMSRAVLQTATLSADYSASKTRRWCGAELTEALRSYCVSIVRSAVCSSGKSVNTVCRLVICRISRARGLKSTACSSALFLRAEYNPRISCPIPELSRYETSRKFSSTRLRPSSQQVQKQFVNRFSLDQRKSSAYIHHRNGSQLTCACTETH